VNTLVAPYAYSIRTIIVLEFSMEVISLTVNFKRKRPKNSRAGCLMCKPHKANGMKGMTKQQTLQEQKAREAERRNYDK
jgi:hypothetical protein